MKRAYKLTPVSMYDVHGLEKWLEKLAAQGLFLKKYRPLVCTFLRDEPKHVRYRLEPCRCDIDGPPDDMLDLYQEYGWQHVGGVNHEMVIFSCADPHAPEPHTDPDIQLEQWNKLYQKARKDFHDMALSFLICLAFCTGILFWGGTPLARLLSPTVIVWDFLFFLLLRPLFDLGSYYSRARELAAVIRELEEQPPKRRPWFPSRQIFSWVGTLYIVLLLTLALILSSAGRNLSLPRPVTEFPPLYVTDQESGITLGTDTGRYGFSLLCWNQRELWEFKTAEDRLLYLEIRWFDFPDWLSFLAVPSAKDLLTDSMKVDGDHPWRTKEPLAWTARDYPGSGADWLSVAESEDGAYHTAAAALADKVVLVRYIGSGDLSDCLDDIVAMVK